MSVELASELESRLEAIARQRSVSVERLVEEILESYLNALAETPAEWVRTTQERLPEVWSREDFADWQPPHAQ